MIIIFVVLAKGIILRGGVEFLLFMLLDLMNILIGDHVYLRRERIRLLLFVRQGQIGFT